MALRYALRNIVLVVVLAGVCHSCMSPAKRAQARLALQSEMDSAIEQVREIVNQPVTRLVRRDDMQVSTYRPGWFHAGAARPDFNNVDVRKTRQTPYAKNESVTSDLNPGFVFLGSELEFNSSTKYFYEDYSLPKKKLSDEEMDEINRLYHVIGHCEQELAKL